MYNEELETLIDAALADGVLTEKEKQILFKKAQAMGVDLDEFEMVLEARLFEVKQGEQITRSSGDAKKYIMDFRKKFDEAVVYAPTGKYGKDELVPKDTYYKKLEMIMTENPSNPDRLNEFLLFLEDLNDYGCLRKAKLLIDNMDVEMMNRTILKNVIVRLKNKYKKEKTKYLTSKVGGIVCIIGSVIVTFCGETLASKYDLGSIIKIMAGIPSLIVFFLGIHLYRKDKSWKKLWNGEYDGH